MQHALQPEGNPKGGGRERQTVQVSVCVCVLDSKGFPTFTTCSTGRGWQQERESATNEDTLDFLVILGLIIPAYLP